MALYMTWLPLLVLMMVTAAGYAFATVGMQMSSAAQPSWGIPLIVLGLAGAALAEIALLRNASLPLVYLGIVVAETTMIMTYAAWSQNGLSLQQIGGAALVIVGFAMVCNHG